MQSFMQWATAYGIPAALGVAKTFENEVEIVKDEKEKERFLERKINSMNSHCFGPIWCCFLF